MSMNHSVLKKFAQNATKLMKQIGTRLEYVRHQDDPYLRAHQVEKKKIEDLIQKKGKEQLIEETAYIWFNRLHGTPLYGQQAVQPGPNRVSG